MKGFREGTNWICQAYASRFVFEEEGKMRSGIEFEVVEPEKLAPFLKRDKALVLDSQSEAQMSLLTEYLENGADGEAFYQKKLAYFGDADDIYYVTVWFDVPAEAEQIILTDWYILEENGEYDYQVVPFMADDPIQAGKCAIYLANPGEREILNELMSIRTFQGKTAKVQREKTVGAIDQDTEFYGATVYYVGAALCVGIFSAQFDEDAGYLLSDQTEIYFDFGYKSGLNSSNAYVRGNANRAVANLAVILQDLIDAPAKNVILSHWHNDHICLVRQIRGDHDYDDFWTHSYWIVPETNAPVANIVAGNLNTYGGTLEVLPNVFPANDGTYCFGGNPNLILGKIDAFDPASPAGRHPHHHGIYAKVQFINEVGMDRKEMLLVGDCTYEGIPAAEKNDCAFLQVCHHGGNYSLPPCNQNPDQNYLDIPFPSNDANYRCAVYSANGVTHGHPNADIMARHEVRGWIASWRTDRAENGLFWIDYDGIWA